MNNVAYYQQQIDQTIQALGGYWRPLSGLARLIEELGEVHELMLQGSLYADVEWQTKMASELTDLYIISTSLANQYCADLEVEYKKLGYGVTIDAIYQSLEPFNTQKDGLFHMTSQSGQIARILNHYEGDKKKKSSETHKSLACEIATLHTLLLRFAQSVNIPLFDYIQETLDKNLNRDKNRFDSTHDPSTEPSRVSFIQALQKQGKLSTRKLWGALPWNNDHTIEQNVLISIQTIERWIKCGEAEGIEGVVFEYKTNEPVTLDELLNFKDHITKVLQDHFSIRTVEVETYSSNLPITHPSRIEEQSSTFYYIKRKEGQA